MPPNQDFSADTQWRQGLLARIFSSTHFAHAYSLRRILEFIVAETPEPDSTAPKEYDIAVRALLRPDSFDPKTDPIIRVSMTGIRDRLRSYFENEGRHEPVRMSIPKGQYRASYEPNTGFIPQITSAAAAPTKARRLFWAPYLEQGRPNILVFTEVLFYRDVQGNYVRNIYVNDLATGASQLSGRGLPLDPGSLRPSFHFVSAGEMHSLLSITRAFQEMHAPLEVRNSRFFSWTEVQGANLILLGSSRTNPFLSSLQGKEPLVITQDSILNTKPRKGESRAWKGRRYFEGELERVEEYALVTRRPGLAPDTAITLISANHGRAIEGAGHFVTREDSLKGMLESMRLPSRSALPDHFQVLLQVQMIDFVEEPVHVEYVTHRTIGG